MINGCQHLKSQAVCHHQQVKRTQRVQLAPASLLAAAIPQCSGEICFFEAVGGPISCFLQQSSQLTFLSESMSVLKSFSSCFLMGSKRFAHPGRLAVWTLRARFWRRTPGLFFLLLWWRQSSQLLGNNVLWRRNLWHCRPGGNWMRFQASCFLEDVEVVFLKICSTLQTVAHSVCSG